MSSSGGQQNFTGETMASVKNVVEEEAPKNYAAPPTSGGDGIGAKVGGMFSRAGDAIRRQMSSFFHGPAAPVAAVASAASASKASYPEYRSCDTTAPDTRPPIQSVK